MMRSKFAGKLTDLLDRKGMSANQLGEVSGVKPSQISRFRVGDQKWVSGDTMRKLLRGLAATETERAELVLAYLLDVLAELRSDDCRLEDVRVSLAGSHEFKEDFAWFPSSPSP